MTSHAQRRRRKLAAQLKVSNRTAANIIKARTAERHGEKEGTAEALPAPEASLAPREGDNLKRNE